ncbi:uncharacterized protein LOC121524682 [Cheilinus undulatus]|uniref:uncharacterized protein LOC121524682 n=1 Tax=Cheilinus undulatus TaxID=241271 RepID=UPI001BD3C24E|nr:uncharacterized protein LOC121524682 [Cheilinus undulatus]
MALSKSSGFDHISKRLIRSGSPTVYQLNTKKENIGTLTRITFGKKDPNKENKTILLVGETKTGKSTLINTFVNYAMGVEWEDDVWFNIVEKVDEESESETETSDVIVYEIFGFEDKPLPYSLTIIDTPGYGNTRGTEQDHIISQRLLDLFRSEDGVHEINVVGLVLKATENRLNDQLRYIFDSAVSLFGKDMENKIVAILTHSTGVSPENALTALKAANIRCAKDADKQPVHFLFNNCQQEDRTEGKEVLIQRNKITKTGWSKFSEFLDQTEPQKLETTVTVLNERIRLKACIQNLQERVELIEKQQKEIQQTEEMLKKHEQKMRSNENFTVEVDEVYKEKQPFKGGMWLVVFYEGAVCCTKCEENCHYPGCTMAWYPRDCEVMRRGRCTSCRGKCPVSDHVKEEKIYMTKTRKVQQTLQEVKEKYDRSKADCEKTTSLLEDLERKKQELQRDKDQWLEESFKHVVNLEQIALNVDSLSTHIYLDFLIKKMKERGDTEKVQKLEQMKARLDKGARAGLQYMFGRVRAGVTFNY